MTGRDEIIGVAINRSEKFIALHPFLRGYYYYLMANKSAQTADVYLHAAYDFIVVVGKDAKDLTFDDFAFYINYSKRKKNGDPITNSAQIGKYHAIKTYCTYLCNTRVIPENYMDRIPRPKAQDSQQTIQKREKGFLTKEEIKLYLETVRQGIGTAHAVKIQSKYASRDYAIMLVFLTTGIRVSALAALDLDDFNITERILWVTDKGNKVKDYRLSEPTVLAIREWIKDRENIAREDEKSLFVTQYGIRMMPEAYRELVKKYAVTINGKHITPHKLRATYGTQLYEATNDIYFVQKAMGHASPATTERYIRGQKNATAQASDIMGSLI